MRGTYCVVANLCERSRIRIGSLGLAEFPPGIYVYIGSALSGIENRVSRHRSTKKKRRWHIDYFLDKAEVVSVIAIPSDRKSIECDVATALMTCEDASVPLERFGSSDCKCRSHLIFFGDADPEWVAEAITMRISMLGTIYQRVTAE